MELLKSLNIFFVDDDAFSLSLYQQHASRLGCQQIKTFESGTACLNCLTENPDIIFLDHGMSEITGIEILKKIKRFNPDIYVVFISGQENITTAVNALKFGAFDYIVKGELELENITRVLNKITETMELLKKNNPSFIKKLLSFM